jgi:hypothetical protein
MDKVSDIKKVNKLSKMIYNKNVETVNETNMNPIHCVESLEDIL